MSEDRKKYLAPCGPAVIVRFSGHAREQWKKRLERHGYSLDAIADLIRSPIGKKRDEFDPGQTKVYRWSTIVLKDGRRVALKVPLVVVQPTTESGPGEVLVVTVVAQGEAD